MVNLTESSGGVILPVRAQPGASKSGIRGEHNGALKVAVTQVAEHGKANQALIEALAEGLDLNRSQIELLSGASQRQKRFVIQDITLHELAQRIAAALAD
jgi:uncharacterized protein (TIGR00251 family)